MQTITHHRGEGCVDVKLEHTASNERYEEDVEGEREPRKHSNRHRLQTHESRVEMLVHNS